MDSYQKILNNLDEITKEIEKNPDRIPDNIFAGIEHLCLLYNQWNHRSKHRQLHTPLEEKFNSIQMNGGAIEPEFEESYKQLEKKLEDIATQSREIMRSLGIVSFDNNLLNSIQKISINSNARKQVYTFLSVAIETLRIWLLLTPLDVSDYKFFLSITQTFLDIVRGQLKQAAVSSLGIFNNSTYKLSVFGRFLLNMVEMTSPDLEMQIGLDLYQNTKSNLSTLLLWFFSTFAPERLQTLLNTSFKEIQKIIREENINTTKFDFSDFNELDIELPYKVSPSYEDLLNLQELLQKPEFLCKPEIQALLIPIRRVQTLRLVCDLLNLPIGKAEYNSVCAKNMTLKNKNSSRRKTRRNTTS